MDDTVDGYQLSVTKEGRAGSGNWRYFKRPLEEVMRAAERWRVAVAGAERLWLCWNVNDTWCVLQQRLVTAVGWTPVVGWDPNGTTQPPLVKGAIAIDFNADLKLPTLWMHFPLEFAFLWADRLAFWHSDLLVRLTKLQRLADRFAALPDGQTAAVAAYGSYRRPWSFLNFNQHRYFELIGCTTRGASASQFETGAGWWRCIEAHPNCTDPAEQLRRRRLHYDHGTGIMYWKRRYRGTVQGISGLLVREGHFAQWAIGAPRDTSKAAELQAVNLRAAAQQLGLTSFLE